MIGFEIGFIISFIITLTALLVGYSLGAHQTPIPPDTQRKMNRLFRKVVPSSSDLGPVERPTQKENYRRDHPKETAIEDEVDQTFENLSQTNKIGFNIKS